VIVTSAGIERQIELRDHQEVRDVHGLERILLLLWRWLDDPEGRDHTARAVGNDSPRQVQIAVGGLRQLRKRRR
jgi:hypothetical protein